MGFCIRLVRLDFSQRGPSERPERTETVRRCEPEAGAQEGPCAHSRLLGCYAAQPAMPIHDLDKRISTNRDCAPILRPLQIVIVSRLLKISGCACFQRALFVVLVRC